jgi:hypothetical protein
MKKLLLPLNIFLTIAFGSIQAQSSISDRKTVEINYFFEKIEVAYSSSMYLPFKGELNEQAFFKFYQDLSARKYHVLLGNLFYHKKNLGLNDWLYYQLIRKSVQAIFPKENNTYHTLFSWFILSKSGYIAEINYTEGEVRLVVYSDEKIFEAAYREHEKGWMIDLSSLEKQLEYRLISNQKIDIFSIFATGKPFSFRLNKLPNFTAPDIVSKQLPFVHDNKSYNLDIDIDKNMLYIRWKYPTLKLSDIADIPMSSTAHNSIVSELKNIIKDKTNNEALRMLLSFVRTGFEYETDLKAYQTDNLAFSAEETLFYRYSDCEDRAVLFKFLVEKVLNLDVLLLDYTNHVTCAVLLPQPQGKPIIYQNKKYTICDPTGPGNHLKIGELPAEYQNAKYEIIE